MALIKCPECGREISDKAEACPHCGNPMAKTGSSEPVVKVEKTKKTIKLPKINSKIPPKLIARVLVAIVVVAIFTAAGIGLYNTQFSPKS